MAKGNKKTTTKTSSADKATTDMQGRVYGAAQKAANDFSVAGVDPNMTSAMGVFGNMAGYGDVGGKALSGDQASVDAMMNPYIKNVLGGLNDQFGRTSDMVRNSVDSSATSQGAFGGDRSFLERGAAQGELARGHQQQSAGLLHQGYNDAMARAGGLANLGMGAAGAQFDGGSAIRDITQQKANPEIMRQQILAGGMQTGNAGNRTEQQVDYTKTGALQNIIGAGATIGGLMGGMPGLGSMAAGLFGNSAATRQAGMTPPSPSQLPNVNRSIWGGY